MKIEHVQDIEKFIHLHEYEKSHGISKWKQTRIVTSENRFPAVFEARCLTLWEKVQKIFGCGRGAKQTILRPIRGGFMNRLDMDNLDPDVYPDYAQIKETIKDIVDKTITAPSSYNIQELLKTAVLVGNAVTVKRLLKDGAKADDEIQKLAAASGNEAIKACFVSPKPPTSQSG